MINKRLSLILLAIVVVIEVVTLIFMRGDYRSVMTTGAEYKVPAQIQFKGDFYNKNYLGITIPITEAPWEGSAPAHRGEEIYLKPVVDNDGLMTISGATDKEPGGNYIITRVESINDSGDVVRFAFPASRLYMSPEQLKKLSVVELSERVQVKDEKGKKVETRMKNEIYAQIKIKDGRVVISQALVNGSPVDQTFLTVGKRLSVKYVSGPKEKDTYSVGGTKEEVDPAENI